MALNTLLCATVAVLPVRMSLKFSAELQPMLWCLVSGRMGWHLAAAALV
jgi:hypothetical protein